MFATRDVERAQRQALDAQAEAERARLELDELKRQQEREADEREQRHLDERRAAMPSNRLYHGEIRNAREAFETHIALLRHEAAMWVKEPEDSDAPDGLKDDPWPKWIEEAERLLREYDETVGAAERALAERWAAQPDGSYSHIFGSAMLATDYSRLAI